MLHNKINVNFNLRKPKSTTPTPINVVIRYNGDQFTYPTSEKILPANWQNDKAKKNYGRAKQLSLVENFSELNARLDNISTQVKEIFRRYKNDNQNSVLTKDVFKQQLDIAFKRVEQKSTDFLKFITDFIKNANNRTNTKTGKKISSATIKKYQTTYNHLKKYSEKKHIALQFDSITLGFYEDYKAFLATEYNHAVNSIGKDITVIKTFLNDSFERKLHTNVAYKSNKFVSTTEIADTIYLNEEELKDLYSLDLTANTTYEKVRDLFLIACYTGLRYSDYSILSKEHISDDLIKIKTYKTGETVMIPLHPIVKEIAEKYDYIFPKAITNQKTNKYLKEIGKLVPSLKTMQSKSITKGGSRQITLHAKYELITTHTGRRSFATNLYLGGFPTLNIMKLTGHRTESSFMAYIKITNDSNAKALAAHWAKTA